MKVRGHRVELEAVESVIAACDNVAECVVVPVKAGAALTLVAVVSASNPQCVIDVPASFLVGRLPAACIPERVLQIDEFVRTSNGKVDRAAVAQFVTAERSEATGSPVEGDTLHVC